MRITPCRCCLAFLILAFVLFGPVAIRRAQAANFVVNDTSDYGDANPGNGVCSALITGKCTLRAAIQEANATAGTTDTITFNLGSGLPSISASLELPHITSPVVIDGATGGATLIEINGSNAGSGASGLVLDPGSGGSQIKALAVRNFASYGILVRTNGNTIQNCYVIFNGLDGLIIFGGANNLIGGATAGARNIVGGNRGPGVTIFGSAASGNRVQGNYIGVGGYTGNATSGVRIDSAPNNLIGGNQAGERNIISDNDNDGVLIIGSTATGNSVQGNYIGTTEAGTAANSNGFAGVSIGSPNNTVGGTTPGAGNLISGNGHEGVYISSSGNQVQGNLIGTDVNGTADVGNILQGVRIQGGTNNTIGGTAAGARNLISGNDNNGVQIDGSAATGNLVQGNIIGTDVNGTTALGNLQNGVSISGSPNNTIGGTVSGARNVISGNGDNNVLIEGSGATGNTVAGNFIGTNATGTAALNFTPRGDGVRIDGAPGNLIGGTTPSARNVISGWIGVGVMIGGGASGNSVQGNYIGTDVSGTVALGNRLRGVGIVSASNNLIGGQAATAGNLISGNHSGVEIFRSNLGDATGNKVQGNRIGTDASGTAPLGNSFYGVTLSNVHDNLIGGGSGLGNIIAFNGQVGVSVFIIGNQTSNGNAILGNSIFENRRLGINLYDGVYLADDSDVVTPNDAGDADTGPNNFQNYPVITSAVNNLSANTTTIQGTLNSTANTIFTIQIFSSAAADPTGYGEGQTFRASTTVTTDANGNAAFSVTLNTAIPAGQVITATATDPSNNTSEFSQTVAVNVQTFTISGRITNSQGGAGLEGVTVTFSGSQSATAQTDVNGNYTFTALAGGSYTVTPFRSGFTFSPPSQTFSNLGSNSTANFVGTLIPVVQLSQTSYTINEDALFATLTVTRLGDASQPASVKYQTSDQTDVNFQCNPATQGQVMGFASRKCDYHITVGRLRFNAGETSKQIIISVVDDVYVEGPETFTLTLSGPAGTSLGANSSATITITDNDVAGQPNPIDNTRFFVRQLYVDLLSREPDPSGWDGWVHRIDFCGQPGEPPPPCDRVTVGGDGFLRSTEFFDREFFVIRLYRTALGRILRYDDVGDLAFVSGFLTDADLELNKQEVVTDIMSRSEFATIYSGLSNSQYVDSMIQTAAVTLPAGVRDSWVNALNGSTKTRAQVFRELSERPEVSAKYLHEAQVVSCYYGFFTRNPDGAYFNYLQRLDSGEINLGDLANAFINAAEYRQRFGP